jgi:processive 1,2-diacylglycerol beta-glucosyltransferase
MAQLYDDESGSLIGTITDEQLQYLVEQLEEEDSEDQNYYISLDTVAWFEDEGADPALIALLTKALGAREGMDIRWTEGQ